MELTTTYQKIGECNNKKYGASYAHLELWAKYNSQSIENNTSNVSVELRLVVTTTGGYIRNQQATYCSISGDLAISENLGSRDYVTSTLETVTGNISHSGDGTKSVSFNGSFNPTAWGSGYTMTVTGSADLPTIPRSSSITSITGGTLGQTITVAISRASSSFTHNVYCKLGSRTQTIASGAGTSVSATLDMNFANEITSGTTQTATMYVETYNGNTLIGTTTSNFTMTVPSSVVPTISSVTKSDTANLLSTYGDYVQGKSNLRIQTNASGAYSSSISSCTVKLKSGNTVLRTLSGTDVTISGISYTGQITIEVTVTDTRGRTSETNTSTIGVLAYNNPNITMFTAERLNNDNTVTLKWYANITPLYDINSKNFKIQYRQKGNTTWTDLTSTYTSAYTYSNTSGYTTTKDDNYGWEFRMIAWDDFVTSSNPSSKEAEVGTAFELMNFGSNGTSIGFGKVATSSNSFECALNSTFSGTTLLNEVYLDQNSGASWYLYPYTVDLSSLDQSTYYPVVSNNIIPREGLHRIVEAVALNSGTVPSWSTHSYGFSSLIDVLQVFPGWGTNVANTTILEEQYNFSNVKPGWYNILTQGNIPCFYLRGGGKYYLFTDWKTDWTIHTSSYTYGSSDTVAPTTVVGVSQGRTITYTNQNNNFTAYQQINTNGKYIKFGCENSSFSHYITDANYGHWFNKDVYVQGDIYGGSNYSKLVAYNEQLPRTYTNGNGSYIQYDDGTLICSKTVTGTANITTSWGNGYTTGSSNTISLGDFPATFISAPVINVTIQRSGYNFWLGSVSDVSTTSAGKVSLLRFTSQSGVDYTINVIAIGKWK